MDPIANEIEEKIRRRGRYRLFRHRKVPVRALIPNFFTLLGLCAGLTAIRMAIEARYDWAIALIALAAFLDGIDGRLARLLKVSSRFGAELDSLADFVNFGVAPAMVIFIWGLQGQKSLGWIVVMIFALCSAMRLARFNAALEDDRPKWQSNYFTGVPTPAAAIVVLLPLYLERALEVSVSDSRFFVPLILAFTLLIAFLMVSTLPTYSGKLLHERISRDYVMPLFVLAMLIVALLLTYPFPTLSLLSILYLVSIPVSIRRFRLHQRMMAEHEAEKLGGSGMPASEMKH